MLSSIAPLLALAAVVAPVQAQQAAYQQCGGINYSGVKSCSSGLVCSVINDYYHQCLPGAATPTPAPTSSSRPGQVSSTRSTAAGSTLTTVRGSATTTAAPSATVPAASGNPFAGRQFWANPYYSSEVHSLAIPSLPASLKPAASAVAKIGSYVWLDTIAKVPTMDTYLAQISADNKAGASPPYMGTFVVYDLPDRDCAALASNGELSIANGGVAKYKTSYIDAIVAIVKKYPDVKLNLVIEPDSLANMVTNLNVPKCANAAPAYRESIAYALKSLNLPNVDMYLDAGHAGWLGWTANLAPAAAEFAAVFKAAGSPARVRGLATNVSNYNAWSIATCPAYTQGNANCDEKRFINAFAPLLTAAGFPAHFIVDQGRSGKQPTGQTVWGEWCNQVGAGFGIRPTTNTGDPLVDAFVWIKPGGESDGTSDQSATRYDSHCGSSTSLKPAPEAGQWFQAYFQQLLVNSNPSFL